jgi:hypothetical protein
MKTVFHVLLCFLFCTATAKAQSAYDGQHNVARDRRTLTDVVVYQHPESGALLVKSEQRALELEVYNIQGELIFRTRNTTDPVFLPSLRPGTYVVQVYYPDKKVTQKIVLR